MKGIVEDFVDQVLNGEKKFFELVNYINKELTPQQQVDLFIQKILVYDARLVLNNQSFNLADFREHLGLKP